MNDLKTPMRENEEPSKDIEVKRQETFNSVVDETESYSSINLFQQNHSDTLTKDEKQAKLPLGMKTIELKNIVKEIKSNDEKTVAVETGYNKISTPKKPKWFFGHKVTHRILKNKGVISIILPYDSETQSYQVSNTVDLDCFDNKEYILNTLETFNKSNSVTLENFSLPWYINALYMFVVLVAVLVLLYFVILISILTLFNPMVIFILLVLLFKFLKLMQVKYQSFKKAEKSKIFKNMISKENQYCSTLYKLTWDFCRDGLYLQLDYKKQK